MLLSTFLLSISSSIDSLGIGITYGIKNTSISNKGKLVIFFVSFIVTIVSLYLGNILKFIFPDFIVDYLGSFLFIIMGIFICFQTLNKNKNIDNKKTKISKTKTYSFFIKFLGITIKIIKDPISSDLDNSNKIDSKEAFFLALALSMDSLCVGIAGSIIGINTYIFPFLIGFFQLFFLGLGNFLGKKIYNFSSLPSNLWSIVSGILLILLGILKILI